MPDTEDVDYIYDVTTDTFEAKVIEASKERPVVVDFWAEWCAPCKALGPILEKVIRSHDGRAVLAKVNVDENQPLAAACAVQGIPAVKVFVDARLATQFVGALPEPEVQRILSAVIPSAADETAEEALRLLREGDRTEAEKRFRDALADDEKNPAASLGLALLTVERGHYDEARRLASAIEPGAQEHAQAQAILTQLDFVDQCKQLGGRAEVGERFAADETNLDARYDLAVCLAAEEQYQPALDHLLAVVAADKHFRDGAAKDTMVRIFSIVGQRSPLADDYRQRLTQVLY